LLSTVLGRGSIGPMVDPLPVVPFAMAPDAVVEIPGSKSLSNRALLAAGLATGTSELNGTLDSEDTQAMAGCLRRLGAGVSDLS
jgi:3-phosphoshikimate 1-carboxyvinyltransferase